MSRNTPPSKKETAFALAALMEIPSQYKATIDLQLLGRRKGIPSRICLPPPSRNHYSAQSSGKFSQSSSFNHSPGVYRSPLNNPSEGSLEDKMMCPICLWQSKNLAFGCGHQTCYECSQNLQVCPMCQGPISTRIRLY